MIFPSDKRQAIGKRIVYFTQFADGLLVIEKERFIKYKQTPRNLQEIWKENSPLPYGTFILEMIRNGLAIQDADNNSLILPHQAVFLKTLYALLLKNKVVEAHCWDDVYAAFVGTFTLTKIHQARSLRDTGKKSMHYRQMEKQHTELLTRIFF